MNPFNPDTIVYENDFIGRESELKELKTLVSNSKTNRILLTAPRRFGKTSLLRNLICNLNKKKFFCIYMDIFNCLSTKDFANLLVKKIAQAPGYSSLSKFKQWVKDNLLSLRVNLKFSTDYQGSISVEPIIFNTEEAALDTIEAALKDLEKIGEEKNVILIIDEFQSILEWDSQQKLERTLRSITQTLRNVNIIFSGSQVKLLHEIFQSAERPFFNQTQSFRLEPIKYDLIEEWIIKTFANDSVVIQEKVVNKIFSLCFANVRHIQAICHRLWTDTVPEKIREIDFETLNRSLNTLVSKKQDDFENLWLQLTLVQKTFLRALAQEESTGSPYGKEFCSKHNLTASSVQVAIPNLELKYLVTYNKGLYYVTDPIFRLWILHGPQDNTGRNAP